MWLGGLKLRAASLNFQRNTFQLVVASMESSSYAVLLYPRDGLQFHSTSVGGETKLLETGFNEGLVQGWFWNNQPGTYFRVTTDEETSIRDLTEYESDVTNWRFVLCSIRLLIYNNCSFNHILPSSVQLERRPQDREEFGCTRSALHRSSSPSLQE